MERSISRFGFCVDSSVKLVFNDIFYEVQSEPAVYFAGIEIDLCRETGHKNERQVLGWDSRSVVLDDKGIVFSVFFLCKSKSSTVLLRLLPMRW